MVVQAMTKEDFKDIPLRSKRHFYGDFSSIVIIPDDTIHESGYRCMTFVLVDKDCEPICKIEAGSDALALDGIGGYGLYDHTVGIPDTIKPKGWTIDCLPCGFLRLISSYPLRVDDIEESTFSVYSLYPYKR